MDSSELHRKLIAAARTHRPSDHVPYAFEKRVMAHLNTRPLLDASAAWAGALWRAVAPCVAIMLLLSAWSFFEGQVKAPVTDLSQDFDNTVLAAVDQDLPVDSTW